MLIQCPRCNQVIVKNKDGFTSGYGLDKDHKIICYDCCAKEDYKWMREHGKIDLYLVKRYSNPEKRSELKKKFHELHNQLRCPEIDYNTKRQIREEYDKIDYELKRMSYDWFIINWPSSLEIHVYHVNEGRHNIAGKQYTAYFSVLYEDGVREAWMGKQYGDMTEIIHCRKLKNTAHGRKF